MKRRNAFCARFLTSRKAEQYLDLFSAFDTAFRLRPERLENLVTTRRRGRRPCVSESGALLELCTLEGVQIEYHDVWGKLVRAPESSLRAFLAEMGIHATNEDAAAGELARKRKEDSGRALPPAVVAPGPGPGIEVPVRVAALPDGCIGWRVIEEGGQRHEGTVAPESLAPGPEGSTSWRLAKTFPEGYHRFELTHDGAAIASCALCVAPATCYQPEAIRGEGRVFGPAVQLYAVRSERNWGIGDLTDLLIIVEHWAAAGADVIALNPLHSMFLHDPHHASPYSPSSRLFLNVLYIDPDRVPDVVEGERAREFVRSADLQRMLSALRGQDLLDYSAVSEIKLKVLGLAYEHFRERHLSAGSDRALAFRAFQAERGEALHLHAIFEALVEHFHRHDSSMRRWSDWPEEFRDPRSPEVARFAAEHAERVQYFQYLQWQADVQLAEVGRRCYELGLGIGLYLDIALAPDRGGSEVWANRGLFAERAGCGAPPDVFNLGGQDWGLPPMVPEKLRETGYSHFAAVLRANMRHAGALRIDHVMALMRLFWVPPGGKPTEGAYVSYPFNDLVGIVALESHRNQCLVVGEDLGTVPPGVRETLARAGVLSYRLLMFEKTEAGEFIPPGGYPRQALVAATTHDLPTLAGFWRGRDIQLRYELGVFAGEEVVHRYSLARAEERVRMIAAVEREGLLPPGSSAEALAVSDLSDDFVIALHVYLARTPSQLMLVQSEDVEGAIEAVNMPGTTDQYPNWRRRLKLPLERWPQADRFKRLTQALSKERGGGNRPWRKSPRRQTVIPRTTYRLQLNRECTLAQVCELVPYLAALGVSHIYTSSLLRARPGSLHGYDITDHNQLNPEIGSQEDFERLVQALKTRGMGLVVDVVPNHMGVMGADNAWWLDVLENGKASSFAGFFDIDWEPVNIALSGRLVVPVLGAPYGQVLRQAELKVAFDRDAGSFSVTYYEHRFPVDPREYAGILQRALRSTPAGFDPMLAAQLATLASSFGHLPRRTETAAEKVLERNRDKEVHKAQLARLARDPVVLTMLEDAARELNGKAGDDASFDALHALLEAQTYRLSYWRVASDQINYRRFFDINDLAALRMEDEVVFQATHGLILEWLVQGKVDALRIDHADGLYDPEQYLRRLQDRFAALGNQPPGGRPLYVVVEKITAQYEDVPEHWPVYGTTGYRFANLVNGLFVDSRAQARMDRTYRGFIGEKPDLEEIIYRAKRIIMRTALAGELNVLANRLWRISQANRDTRDYTLNSLRQALEEVAACFPVYRTYISGAPSAEDRRYVDWAVSRARNRSRTADTTVFGFVRDVLSTDAASGKDSALAAAVLAFTCKFQQFTGPVTAKGVEDTAFYFYNRLVSLNEVGGDPAKFGLSLSAFHGASQDRAKRWPHTMLATSTHDSKRSEDVRARIDAISELPAKWRLGLSRLSRIARRRKRIVSGSPAPSRNDEYLFYQTLLGIWPLEPVDDAALDLLRGRVREFMIKAVREAKVHSSWINTNEEYETAVITFVDSLLTGTARNLFLAEIEALAGRLGWLGLLNSLSMTLVKLASPGVPDIYQGCELWSFALVDPDNRRPVDFALRRRMLADLELEYSREAPDLASRVGSLMREAEDGRPKLYVTWRLLSLRREDPEVFQNGDYLAVEARGTRAEHVVSFARRGAGRGVIACAPRLMDALAADPRGLPVGAAVWADTSLDVSALGTGPVVVNALTGERVPVLQQDGRSLLKLGDVLASFPVALLLYGERAGA